MIDKKKDPLEGGKLSRKQMELLVKTLTAEMNKAARDLDFETAAELRDQILELKAQMNGQKKEHFLDKQGICSFCFRM